LSTWFTIEYSEPEDSWEIKLKGGGIGEDFFSGKRNRYLAEAIKNVIEDAENYYQKKTNN